MPESVEAWWARRQWTKESAAPYPIGRFRADWERYPVLVRQYHPDLNRGITLTQIPPAAEVYLVWVCDLGHHFVATPEEQRNRPSGTRRRSTWCPECSALATGRRRPMVIRESDSGAIVPHAATPDRPALPDHPAHPERYNCGHPFDPDRVEGAEPSGRCALCERLDSAPVSREELLAIVANAQRGALAEETRATARYSWGCPAGHGSYSTTIERMLEGRRCRICTNARAGADRVAVGEAFRSALAPKPASAAEADLRQRLAGLLDVVIDGQTAPNAVRVARPFFEHIEVWPDIVIAELKVAIEYDTTGRDGLEHVGRREDIDRRKDRLLRGVGWEVIRIRCGKLQPLGPHDLVAPGISGALLGRLVDELGAIRGELIVSAYRM